MDDPTLSRTQAGQTLSATQVKRDFGAVEVLRQALAVKSAQEGDSWTLQPALAGVGRALARFRDALASFAWPGDDSAWFQSRLATGASEAQGRLAAATRSGQAAVPETKMLSAGFDAAQPSGLDAGEYAFTLALGARTETVRLNVTGRDTWGQVLAKTQSAVNAAELPVRADVVNNPAAFASDPDMAGVGSVLTFSVNALRADQNLQALDVTGGLLRALGVTATTDAVGAAQTGPYDVSVRALAVPATLGSTPVDPNAAAASLGFTLGRYDLALTTGGQADALVAYQSTTFDPNQASSLSPGTYAFTSTSGGETRAHQVSVGQGWTWGDVLRAVAAEINGQYCRVRADDPVTASPSSTFSQPGVGARVDPWPLPDATRQGVTGNGNMLVVSGDSGQGFALADGSGGLLHALGATVPLTGRAVSFTVGAGDTANDVFVSLALAAGDAAGDALTADRTNTVMPSAAVAGMDLAQRGLLLTLTQQDRRIGRNLHLADGTGGALAATGLSGSAWPGQDGRADINGVSHVSENNTYSQDKGRFLVTALEGTGDNLPLRVTGGMAQLEESLGRVSAAYNDLARTLANNADLLSPALGATLASPFGERAGALAKFGLAAAGRTGQIWTNTDAFWRAAYADTAGARSLFAENDTGLIPAWSRAVEAVRAAGAENWLKPQAGFEKKRPNLTSEWDLERKNRLLDLLG